MKNHHKHISIIAILLFIFGWVSVNIYLPALPFLSHDLHTSTQNLKFSITLFLLGFSISQLFWGPLSEKYGRKSPIVFGLILTNIGIVMAMLATNVTIFNSGRFIEALGLGVAPTLGRAMLIDTHDAVTFAATMAYGTISSNMMPAIAPIIGAHIMIWFGWRYIFAALLLYGLLILLRIIWKIKETHTHRQPTLNILHTFKHYLETIKNREFIGYLLPYTLVTGAMIGYYTLTPFLFVTKLHISIKNYGFLSLITVITYILGAMYSRLFAQKIGIRRMVLHGTLLMLVAAISMLIADITAGLTVASVLIPMSIYTFAAGIICPNSNAGAMHSMRHKAGAAAAMIGFSVYLASAILSTIIGLLPIQSLLPLTIYIFSIALLAFLGFYLLTTLAKTKANN